MIYQKRILAFLLLFLTSCSFDRFYLKPTKVPITSKKVVMKTTTDTTVVVFNGDNHQPTFLKNGKDTLDYDFTIESFIFTNSNGNKLNGWFLKPKNKMPTVTLLHLHGNAGFLLSQYQAMTPLLKFGFQIILFDYSGFGFSEGKAARENLLTDADAAVTFAKKISNENNTKLVIYGQSLGGHLSAVIAEKRQSDIDGLVIEAAFSSHKDIAAKTAGIFGRLLVNEKYAAFKSIRNFSKPTLIIHSIEDKVVPISLGQKIFKNANEHKAFYEIKQCHICGPIFYSDSISSKIYAMLLPKNSK